MTVPRAAVGWLVTAVLAGIVLGRVAGVVSPRMLEHIAVVSFGWALFRVLERSRTGPAPGMAIAVAVSAGLALAQVRVPSLQYMPYLLVAPANLAVAWVFASGLLPGREPVLLRLIRLMGVHPADDVRFRRFIAGQCLIWAVLASTTALAAIAALVSVAMHPWLGEVLTCLVAVQVLWFGLSHYYAQLRYRRPETWLDTVRAMASPEIWQRLRTG